MATIPTYEPNQVQNNTLPASTFGVRASGASFGAGEAANLSDIGQGLGQVGGTLADIGLREQHEDNLASVREQMNTAREDLNGFAQSEYAKNGSDAIGATQRIKEYSEKLREKYGQNFKNTVQQEMFGNVFSQYSSEHTMRAQGFERNQRDIYNQGTLVQAGSIDVDEINSAVASPVPDQPLIESRILDYAANLSKLHSGAGNKQMLVQDGVEKMLVGTVKNLSINNPEAAMSFLNDQAKKGRIDKEVAAGLNGVFQKQAVPRMADALAIKYYGAGSSLSSISNDMDKQGLDPEVKKLVLQGVETRQNFEKKEMKDVINAKEEEFSKSFYVNPNQVIPSDLPADTQKRLRDYKEQQSKGVPVVTDREAYQSLITLSATPEFKDAPLTTMFMDKISPQDLNPILKDQASVRRKAQTGDTSTKVGSLKWLGEQGVKDYSMFNVLPTDSDVVKHQKGQAWAKFHTDVLTAVQALPEDKQNNATEVQKVVDSFLMEEVQHGWFRDTKTGKMVLRPEPSVQGVNAPEAKAVDNLRRDGTKKENGFFGKLDTLDGSGRVSTEISIGVEIDGKEIDIPSLVPTLTKNEIDHLLSGNKPTKQIVDKAVAHAKSRMSKGKSPFAQDGESPVAMPVSTDVPVKPRPLISETMAAKSLDALIPEDPAGQSVGQAFREGFRPVVKAAKSAYRAGEVISKLDPLYAYNEMAIKTIGKGLDYVGGKIGDPIGKAKASQSKETLDRSIETHEALKKAGVSLPEMDEVFKSMRRSDDPIILNVLKQRYSELAEKAAEQNAQKLVEQTNKQRKMENIQEDFRSGKITREQAKVLINKL